MQIRIYYYYDDSSRRDRGNAQTYLLRRSQYIPNAMKMHTATIIPTRSMEDKGKGISPGTTAGTKPSVDIPNKKSKQLLRFYVVYTKQEKNPLLQFTTTCLEDYYYG